MPTVIPGQTPRPSGRPFREPALPTPPAVGGEGAVSAEPRIDPPRAAGALSARQKTRLALAAKAAYERHLKLGLVDEGVTSDAWRRAECLAATGGRVGGLREAAQRDYRQLRGHFANLNGDGATAIDDAIHGDPAEADRDQAWAILARECRKRGHSFPAYPASICRQKYKRPIGEASTRQLWSLIYTVRNRRKKT